MFNAIKEIEQSISSFNKSINNIYSFIEYKEKIEKIIKDLDDEVVNDEGLFQLKNDSSFAFYNGVIISLYGTYEKTLKELIGVYAKFLMSDTKDASCKIKKTFLAGVLKKLEASDEEKISSLIEISYQSFVKNDFSCFNYSFLFENFQNLKFDRVNDMCKLCNLVDIENQIFTTDNYIRYFISKNPGLDYGEAQERIKSNSSKTNFIDDLVNRRNDIAHNGLDNNMLSIYEIQNELIPNLYNFVVSFSHFILNKLSSLISEKNLTSITKIDSIFNNKIVCFNSGRRKFDLETYFIFKNKDRCVFNKCIRIEINHNKVNCCPRYTDAGFEMKNRITDTDSIFVINRNFFEN